MSEANFRIPIVVINLDADAQRMEFMAAQLTRLNLAFERFSAVAGTTLPESVRGYFPREEDGSGFLSRGEIGCYASHLAVYQKIADGRIAAPALVLEDDVELPEDLGLLLNKIVNALPRDWDMVRLSSTAKRAYFEHAPLADGRRLVRYSVSPGSNGAMLVSRRGAQKFLKPSPRRLPVDQDNRRLWAFDLNLFGVVPPPVRGNALATSSIDDLASGARRENRERQRHLRHERRLTKRHAWNMQKFGCAGWAAAEFVTALSWLHRRRARPLYLARMSAWLASVAAARKRQPVTHSVAIGETAETRPS